MNNYLTFKLQCSYIQFYYNIATQVCLGIVYGFFCTKTEELSHWDREYMDHQALLSGPLQGVCQALG